MNLNRETVIWAIPFFLALHNAEEALTFPRYLEQVRGNAPLFMRQFADAANYNQLYGTLVVVTVVPFLVSLWSWLRPQSKIAFWCVLLVQVTVFLNVFAHLSSATTIFHGYGPGVLTALAINLPFSIYLFRRGRAEAWFTRKETIWLIPAAIFVHGPGLIAAFAAGRLLS